MKKNKKTLRKVITITMILILAMSTVSFASDIREYSIPNVYRSFELEYGDGIAIVGYYVDISFWMDVNIYGDTIQVKEQQYCYSADNSHWVSSEGKIGLDGSGFDNVTYNSSSGSTKYDRYDFDSPASIYHTHDGTVATEVTRDAAYSDTIWMDTPDTIDLRFYLVMTDASPHTWWIEFTGSFD